MATAKTPVAAKAPTKAAAPAQKTAVAAPKKATKAPAPAPAEQVEEAAPKKPRLSATQEEIDALVRGELAPRELVGTTDQEQLTMRSENNRPVGRPIGITTGLPIMLCWGYVFQQNELAPDGQKMTDPEIAEFMKSEFPGRETNAFDNVQYCRRLYNTGRFTKNAVPKVQSNRFNAEGQIDNPTRGFGKKAEEAAPAAPAKPAPKAPAKVAPKPAAKAPAVKRPAAATA